MEKRYLMTQSLLSAWLYQYNCAEGYEEEARESFLKTLRREPTESSESMERGIAFEDAVYEVICGNKTAAAAYASQWSKRGEEVPEGACILELAEQLSGGIYQLTAYKEKTISGERFLLMAKCDWVKAGVIYDCKRVERYEVGKYYASPQHPMYLEVIDTALRRVDDQACARAHAGGEENGQDRAAVEKDHFARFADRLRKNRVRGYRNRVA